MIKSKVYHHSLHSCQQVERVKWNLILIFRLFPTSRNYYFTILMPSKMSFSLSLNVLLKLKSNLICRVLQITIHWFGKFSVANEWNAENFLINSVSHNLPLKINHKIFIKHSTTKQEERNLSERPSRKQNPEQKIKKSNSNKKRLLSRKIKIIKRNHYPLNNSIQHPKLV